MGVHSRNRNWAPSFGAGFRQIDEGANPASERGELRVNGSAACRNEPGANAGAEVQPVASIEADQNGIEAVGSWRVVAYNQFLRKFHAQLGPGTGAFSLLIGAGKTLGDNPFETVTPYQLKHLRGWNAEAL